MAVPGPSAMPAWAGTVFDKHLQVGKEYLLAAKFEMALKEFDAALRISPGDANALVERGTAYNGLGKYDLAIKDFSSAIQATPQNYLAYNNRGVAYFRKLELKRALQDLDKALSINADDPVAYLNRAGVALCDGSGIVSARKIEAWLKRTAWRDRYACHAAVLAAYGFKQGGDTKAYQEIIDQALKRTDRLLWPYPVLRYLKGTLKDKSELLHEAEESDYDSTQAHCFIGLDLVLKGKTEMARPHFEWIVKHGIQNSVEYWIARGMKI